MALSVSDVNAVQRAAQQGLGNTPAADAASIAAVRAGGGVTPDGGGAPVMPPAAPPAISANGLTQTPPNPITPPAATTQPPNTAIPSIDQLIADYSNPSSAENAAGSNVNDLTSRITSLLTKQGTEAQTTQNLNQSMGVNDIQSQLNELNKQMTDIASQRDQAKIAAESQGAPQFIINGDQQRLDHEASIKLLGLSAAATALQGNLSLATQRVQQAIDLEFKPITSQIQAYQLLLNNAKDQMTKAQQDKADALKIQLSERSRLLDQQQSDKKDVYNVMMEAAKNGADNTTLNNILAAKNGQDAIAAAGSILQGSAIDMQIKRAQLTNAQLSNQKLRQDLTPSAGTYTPGANPAVDAYVKEINAGSAKLTDVPNSIKNLVVQGLSANPAAPQQSQYQIEGNRRIIQAVDNLLPQINSSTTGLNGRIFGSIPGLSQYNFRSQINTLKANIAFGALTQMREASKTGGALGQISDREEVLLSSVLGSLDPNQSASALRGQLQQVKDSITRWNQAVSATNNPPPGAIPAPDGSGDYIQITDQ